MLTVFCCHVLCAEIAPNEGIMGSFLFGPRTYVLIPKLFHEFVWNFDVGNCTAIDIGPVTCTRNKGEGLVGGFRRF
jgi:hypothetical protein